jgi:hypothetical protein
MEHCKGCKSKDNCEKYIDIIKDIGKCVCRKCLIKGICKDPCDDFINLFKNYYRGKRYLTHVWWIKKYELKVQS